MTDHEEITQEPQPEGEPEAPTEAREEPSGEEHFEPDSVHVKEEEHEPTTEPRISAEQEVATETPTDYPQTSDLAPKKNEQEVKMDVPIDNPESERKGSVPRGSVPRGSVQKGSNQKSSAPRGSVQRTSIDKSQETFIPPGAKKPSISSDRRSSISERMKSAIGASDRNLTSPSATRKSKFGGLSSKARMVLGSIVDIKGNIVGDTYDKKAAKYQNTYRLESENPFNPEQVYKILRDVMNEAFENLQYDSERCPSQAKWASKTIRSKVKALEFDRYKLVCIVTIGEKNSQDVYATCRFLWDTEKDRFSTYSLENTNIYGIAYCFGLYYE